MKKPEWREMVVLPWLTLDETVTFNGVEFHPCTRKSIPDRFKPYRKIIKNIMLGYLYYFSGRPVGRWALISLADQDPCAVLDEAVNRRVVDAVSVLTFCAIAENRYYDRGRDSFNSSYFEVHARRFDMSDPEWRANRYRKREGYVRMGGAAKFAKDDFDEGSPSGGQNSRHENRFTLPLQAGREIDLRVDIRFLTAIENAIKIGDSLSRRLLQGINLFNEANTCRDTVREEWEIVLMASALEHLLAKTGSHEVVELVGGYFMPYCKTLATDSVRSSNLKHKQKEHGWYLVQKWVQELHFLRSRFIHGLDVSNSNWGWSRQEHLVMAAYFFPLLVKVMLAHERLYSMTEEDENACELVDIHLNEKDWDARCGHGSRWRDTFFEYSNKRQHERIRERISADLCPYFAI